MSPVITPVNTTRISKELLPHNPQQTGKEMKVLILLTLLVAASARRRRRPSGGSRPTFASIVCDNGALPACADGRGNEGVWVCRTRTKDEVETSKTICINPDRSIDGTDACGVCEGDDIPVVADCPGCDCTTRDDENGLTISFTRKEGESKDRCMSVDRATSVLTMLSDDRASCCTPSN